MYEYHEPRKITANSEILYNAGPKTITVTPASAELKPPSAVPRLSIARF